MYAYNTEFTIRKATPDDIDMLISLLPPGDQRIGFGKTAMTREKFIEYINVCIRYPHHDTFLYYRGDELVSMMACCDSTISPYWCALNFKVFRPRYFLDVANNGWIHLGEHIAQLKESQGRFSFYYVKTIRKQNKYMEKNYGQLLEFSKVIGNRYIRTVEEYIPAGQTSQHEFFKRLLMRNSVFAEDVAITKWTCMQEYRTGFNEELQEQTVAFSKHITGSLTNDE